MGTKMAVSFANIFMALIETKLIQQSIEEAGEQGAGSGSYTRAGSGEKK